MASPGCGTLLLWSFYWTVSLCIWICPEERRFWVCPGILQLAVVGTIWLWKLISAVVSTRTFWQRWRVTTRMFPSSFLSTSPSTLITSFKKSLRTIRNCRWRRTLLHQNPCKSTKLALMLTNKREDDASDFTMPPHGESVLSHLSIMLCYYGTDSLYAIKHIFTFPALTDSSCWKLPWPSYHRETPTTGPIAQTTSTSPNHRWYPYRSKWDFPAHWTSGDSCEHFTLWIPFTPTYYHHRTTHHPRTSMTFKHDPIISWQSQDIQQWSKYCLQHCIEKPLAFTSVESPEHTPHVEIPSIYRKFSEVFSKQWAMKLPPHRT